MQDTPWFDLPSLQPQCDSGAWQRGLALQRGGQVLGVDVAPLRDRWLLQGQVQDTRRQPHSVSIELSLRDDGTVDSFDGDCCCPVARQCKHTVAVLAEAAEGRWQGFEHLPAAALRQTLQARSAEAERGEAEACLLRWFDALDQVCGQSGAPRPGTARRGGPGERPPEQYLYLLTAIGAPRSAPQLQLEAVLSRPQATGGWSKPQRIRTPPGKGQAAYDRASEADRQVLQLLRALSLAQGAYYSAHHAAPCAVVDGAVGVQALQQAAGTGRLFADVQGAALGAPLQWGQALAPAWHWHEEPASAPGRESAWTLRANLASATATLCHHSPPLYLDAARGRCGPVQGDGLAPAQLEVLLQAPSFTASALHKHQAGLLQRLGPVPLPPALHGAARLTGIAPVARLHLSPTPAGEVPAKGLITAQLRFDYHGCVGWWSDQPLSLLVDGPTGPVLLQRDGPAEQGAIDRLQGLGLQGSEGGGFGIPGAQPQHAWMHWADHGFEALRAAGFALTLDADLDGWIAHAQGPDVQLQPAGGAAAGAGLSPWFDLSLGMEVGGQRHNILPSLPELISAAAAQPPDPVTGLPTLPPFVYLRTPGRGGFVRLATDALQPWMAALLDLVGERAHDFAGDSLRLSRLDALRVSAALGEGAVWQGAAGLRALVQQLKGQGTLPEVPVPASVQAELRPYQRQGLNWLQFLRAHGLAGILADDMGLGKTLQTLAHIQVEKDAGRLTHPALVIAPVSLLGNWQREAARFCPQLRCLVLHGKERHAVAESMAAHDIVIAPYSLLQRDRARWLAARWHLVVLDEAQHIKNASTHAAQVAGQLQAQHRLCLSGTPMENHLGEVWSLFHFLMPGFLGSQKRFGEWFRTPIEKQGDTGRLAQLRARTAPFMLRRSKALVASELPPKVETVVRVALSGAQADLYETIRLGTEKTVREALAREGLAKSQITILDALLRLRQVCCDPQLVPLEAAKKVKASAKLEQLMELLPGMLAEGRRILLFSQFTSMLALIEAELRKRQLPWAKLTGQSQRRDQTIERFTRGEVPLFLISLKAGGVGLNLPQADTVIHYDPWWNPAAEQQATDRAHRIGQAQSVWVLKLVAQDTLEERILALQERKAQLAGSLYGGHEGRQEPLFSEGDLVELLKPLSSS
ncbi:DEAD/DEAH box helicase [Acidovorax sp. SRB_24]|uniref:DEAD/DEAH box helicase n=1 Tax=Acidovorax sp. SRB_24 TaxID=1962700 RepID=UPI00145D4F4B|nr:DEAD/DEAH box helicase [Acidovorax sp. SRB_24]NMM75302.1 helicase SNF2 [Acidovorax sp. SRB_24]